MLSSVLFHHTEPLEKTDKPVFSSPIFPLLLVLYEIALYLSMDAYLPALPTIRDDLGLTTREAHLTLTMWFFGSASLQLFLGPLSDRFGRRPVLLLGGILFIIATLGCTVASTIDVVLVCRYAQGASVTTMIVAGFSTVHKLFSQKRAIYTVAVMNSVTILAPAFGPFFGTLILYAGSWRLIFYVLVLWAGVALVFLYFKMPETVKSTDKVASFKKVFHDYRSILANRNFVLYTLTSGCLFASMIAWLTAAPFLLIDTYAMSEMAYSFAQVFVFGGFVLGTRSMKLLLHHLPIPTVVRIGLYLALGGGLCFVGAGLLFPGDVTMAIATMTLLAFGTGIGLPIFGRIAVESSRVPMGSRVAVYSFSIGLCCTIGSAIVSGLFDHKAVATLLPGGTMVVLAGILLGLGIVANICWACRRIRK